MTGFGCKIKYLLIFGILPENWSPGLAVVFMISFNRSVFFKWRYLIFLHFVLYVSFFNIYVPIIFLKFWIPVHYFTVLNLAAEVFEVRFAGYAFSMKLYLIIFTKKKIILCQIIIFKFLNIFHVRKGKEEIQFFSSWVFNY